MGGAEGRSFHHFCCPLTGVACVRYRWDLSQEEAEELGRAAIFHATYRDSASGGTASGEFFSLMDVQRMLKFHVHGSLPLSTVISLNAYERSPEIGML